MTNVIGQTCTAATITVTLPDAGMPKNNGTSGEIEGHTCTTSNFEIWSGGRSKARATASSKKGTGSNLDCARCHLSWDTSEGNLESLLSQQTMISKPNRKAVHVRHPTVSSDMHHYTMGRKILDQHGGCSAALATMR